jgi:hypothetical protein
MSAPETPKPSTMPEHVSIVFRQLFDELKAMKQQQWTITNYYLLIIAAVFYLRQSEVSHFHSLLKAALSVTSVIVVAMLILIQRNTGGLRFRIDKIHKSYFSPTELDNIGFSRKEIASLDDVSCSHHLELFCRGWQFLLSLVVVIVGATVLIVVSL